MRRALTHREFTPVTLFAINDNSVANHPWPWSPVEYALFARAVLPFHPAVVAIDDVLDWKHVAVDPAERQKLPQYEKMLADTLLPCPKLLLGARLGWPDDPEAIPPLEEAPIVRKIAGDLRPIPEWTVIEHAPNEEYRLLATLGFTNVPERAGLVNTVPLLLRYRGEIVPSFVLQAILLWQKLSVDDVSAVLGSHVSLGDKLRIPINESARNAGQFRGSAHANRL